MNKYIAKLKLLIDDCYVIFFDFDGVIKDSINAKSEGFIKMIPDISESLKLKIKKHHESNGGLSRYKKIPIYLSWAGIQTTYENLDFYQKKFSDLVKDNVLNSPFIEGVQDFIINQSLEKKLVIVSATPEEELKEIINSLQIKKYFDKVFGTPHTKAKAISDYLIKVKIPSKKAVLIGDSVIDFKAAEQCNLNFILRSEEDSKIKNTFKIEYSIKSFLELM